MGARITRRDFLNGVAITAGAAIIPPEMWAAAAADLEVQDASGYYPPAKTGLRGSHVGSFETMHRVRDGAFWDDAPKPADTGESYDLVVAKLPAKTRNLIAGNIASRRSTPKRTPSKMAKHKKTKKRSGEKAHHK